MGVANLKVLCIISPFSSWIMVTIFTYTFHPHYEMRVMVQKIWLRLLYKDLGEELDGERPYIIFLSSFNQKIYVYLMQLLGIYGHFLDRKRNMGLNLTVGDFWNGPEIYLNSWANVSLANTPSLHLQTITLTPKWFVVEL